MHANEPALADELIQRSTCPKGIAADSCLYYIMNADKKISIVQAALINFIITERPPRLPLVDDEISIWYANHGIVFHRGISTADGRPYGFNAEGAMALFGLADLLLSTQPKLRVGTRRVKLADVLAKAVLTELVLKGCQSVTSAEVSVIEHAVDQWFSQESISRTFLISCSILPDHAASFEIGPVRFISVWDLVSREKIDQDRPEDSFVYGSMLQTMKLASAKWIAEVQLTGFDQSVGTERANLAVDVALVALQMAIPLGYSREISRITARRGPALIGTVIRTGDRIHTGMARNDPCLGISGPAFTQIIGAQLALLDSIGRRVRAYLEGATQLQNLEQAWSDAAYWLHEGLAEPLSSIAIAKLETAVEVLLYAESSKGSEARFLAAYKSFYGLSPTDHLQPGDPQTVKQFVKSVVSARSRVLHGTSPTLTSAASGSENLSRQVVEKLSIDLVRRYTFAIDKYGKQHGAVDETEAFLDWLNQERINGN